MMNKFLIFPVICTLMGVAACSDEAAEKTIAVPEKSVSSNSVLIETARGPVAFTKAPQKLAVFDLGSLDTLTALGVEVAGVPNKLLLPYLDRVLNKSVRVGTLFEPDLEALYHLNPDLVILSDRSAPKFDDVKRIAQVIDMTDNGDNLFGEGLRRLHDYGELMGKPAEAEKIAHELSALLTDTQKMTQKAGTALILMVNGGKLSIFGSASRYGWIHHDLGFAEVVKDVRKAPHGQPISFEFIKQTNPDWLFVIDRGAAIGREGASAQSVLDNALVHETKAWKNGRIIYLSMASYVAPGGVNQIREDLTNILHALKEATE